MRFKKFIIIPILIFIYVYFIVDILVNFNPYVFISTPTVSGAGVQQVAVGNRISVLVTRPYLFGLFRLPVYTNYIGYIGNYHEAFFVFIVALTAIFIVLEWRSRRIQPIQATRQTIKKWEEVKMKGTNTLMKKLLKGIAFGAAFGFISFLITGDGGTSMALALLLIYLEYKM